jgi:hypothetical protein
VARTQRVAVGSSATWPVVDEGHHLVVVIEQYLEFLRNRGVRDRSSRTAFSSKC